MSALTLIDCLNDQRAEPQKGHNVLRSLQAPAQRCWFQPLRFKV